MENICKQLIQNENCFAFENDTNIGDLNHLARKYKLSIYFFDGRLTKSKRYGPEIFVIKKHDMLIGHSNPGKLAKLPSGVNKIKGCKYKLNEIFNKDCETSDLDWKEIEDKYDVGINIWLKTSTGLNKSSIKNLRRSTNEKSINLHCDPFFCKLFLICDKIYFRGHKRLIKNSKIYLSCSVEIVKGSKHMKRQTTRRFSKPEACKSPTLLCIENHFSSNFSKLISEKYLNVF